MQKKGGGGDGCRFLENVRRIKDRLPVRDTPTQFLYTLGVGHSGTLLVVHGEAGEGSYAYVTAPTHMVTACLPRHDPANGCKLSRLSSCPPSHLSGGAEESRTLPPLPPTMMPFPSVFSLMSSKGPWRWAEKAEPGCKSFGVV